MPTVGSLFSGIGGLDLGFERAGWQVSWQVENEPYCQAVLRNHWPDVPLFGDVREVGAHNLSPVDCIIGGFPCQPFSHAGRRTGEGDDRYLWPEMLRVIRELRPTFVVAENVYGLVTLKQGLVLETVYLDLEAEQYEVAPPIVFPAAAVGAPHRRDRVWICAHSHSEGLQGRDGESLPERSSKRLVGQMDTPVPDTHCESLGRPSITWSKRDWWESEPNVGRVAHGVRSRVDRLRALGNAVVPQTAYVIAKALMESWEGARA